MKHLSILTVLTALIALLLLSAPAFAGGCEKDQKCLPNLALKTSAITITIVKDISNPSGTFAPIDFANDGNEALNWRFYNGSIFNGCAVAVPVPVPWLTLSRASGILLPGHQATVVASVSARDLPVGTHLATLCLASDDPDDGLIAIPVTVVVKPAQ